MGCPHQSLPLGVQRSICKRRCKYCQSQRWWIPPRKHYLPATKGRIHIWSHRDCDGMRTTCTPDKVPELKRRSRHNAPLLTAKLFAIDIFWEGESQFSPLRFHWVCQPHSELAPCWAAFGQHKTYSTFFYFFSLQAFCFLLVIFVWLFFVCFVFHCCFVFWEKAH